MLGNEEIMLEKSKKWIVKSIIVVAAIVIVFDLSVLVGSYVFQYATQSHEKLIHFVKHFPTFFGLMSRSVWQECHSRDSCNDTNRKIRLVVHY